MLTQATIGDWLALAAVMLGASLGDRMIFGKASEATYKRDVGRSIFWIGVGVAFSTFVWFRHGRNNGLDYLTAYLIEKSLSVDNLFVFLVIFTYFKLTAAHQHRVLFWGIGGAIVMRAVFILSGTALLQRFHWLMFVFGAFLVFTGGKLLFGGDDDIEPESNLALRFAKRFLRTTEELDGDRFFTKLKGQLHATRLFLVLVVVEFTDVVFAVDSVPAVLAISQDVFIVYASNIFAILGLRALYFVLAGMMSRFAYLRYGLSAILIFIGIKMLIEDWFKFPNWASLTVISGVLVATTLVSVRYPPASKEAVVKE